MQTPFEPLVSVIGGEPLASSLVIARGMKARHKSVIQLIRQHAAILQEFGPLAFEMRVVKRPQGGGAPTEYAMLNEQQAALLISMMRNTDEVVAFKVRLIREFYRMRDALSQRTQNLYQQLQALVAEEVSTQVKASFGSRLMLERKYAIPDFRRRREALESQLQPPLFIH
ncbi:Rha family transcriptional regulator [Castellaniella ginsengisoli]|uniref:Rha family transcriptional regulator n=1 Tax=Castellaniella ginsengisoli TaxID=546114 RepID=A0AB39G330_9BURK